MSLRALAREPLAGIMALPRAFFLIRGSRRLILLNFAGVLATAVFALCAIGLFAAAEMPAASRGPLEEGAMVACALLAAVTCPVFGPLAAAFQLRAIELAAGALGGPAPRRVRLGWWVKTTASTGVVWSLVGVLILGVTSLLATMAVLVAARVIGPLDPEALRAARGAVAFTASMAIAFVRIDPAPSRRALTRLPRFAGYWLATSALSAPIVLLLPALGPVAGLLWWLGAHGETRSGAPGGGGGAGEARALGDVVERLSRSA